jgi:formylglycine-generating enzyme required for sulfatase activity
MTDSLKIIHPVEPSPFEPLPPLNGDARHAASMLLVPAGTFRMGSAQGSRAEAPLHNVNLPDFLMDSTPVTNRAYSTFVEDTGYQTEVERNGSAWGVRDGKFQQIEGLSWRTFATSDRQDHPVILVTWHDATAYCDWAGLRLPTEAEWEKAARGGLVSATFPWGEAIPDGSQSNFAANPFGVPGTLPVARHTPNGLGLHDMVGNVWQWCSDWFDETYYATSLASGPTGPSEGLTRVRRGGAWNVIQPFRLRCANRGAMLPSQTATNMGFRCAKSVVP